MGEYNLFDAKNEYLANLDVVEPETPGNGHQPARTNGHHPLATEEIQWWPGEHAVPQTAADGRVDAELAKLHGKNDQAIKILRKLAYKFDKHGKDILALLDKEVALEEEVAEGATELPIVDIADLAARPRKPVTFLVDGILVGEKPTLISGMEGSFKSFFAMEMALCSALGLPFLGSMPTKRSRVLMIDLENSDQLCNRIEASLERKDKTFSDLRGHFLALDQEALEQNGTFVLNTVTMQRLHNAVKKFAPTLVIIDNLTKSLPLGTDEKLSEQMQPLIDGLVTLSEKQKIALIIVDHDTKGGTMASGSGVKLRLVGNTIHLIHDRSMRVTTVVCSRLRHAKPFKPFAITVDIHGTLVSAALPEGEDGKGGDHLLRDVLRDGAKTAKEFGDQLGMAEKAARLILDLAVVRGVVNKLEEKGSASKKGGRKPVRYGLASHESAQTTEEVIEQIHLAQQGLWPPKEDDPLEAT